MGDVLFVHRNSNIKKWAVRKNNRGKVLHVDNFYAVVLDCKIYKSGWKRWQMTGRKNVHAHLICKEICIPLGMKRDANLFYNIKNMEFSILDAKTKGIIRGIPKPNICYFTPQGDIQLSYANIPTIPIYTIISQMP